MERSVSIDTILQSENLLISKEPEIKNNNLRFPKHNQAFDQEDTNEDDNSIKFLSSDSNINKDPQDERVRIQSDEENEINKSHTTNSISIHKIQDNWKNFIDNLHKKKTIRCLSS